MRPTLSFSHRNTQKERGRGEEGGRCVLFTRTTAELTINDDDDDDDDDAQYNLKKILF